MPVGSAPPSAAAILSESRPVIASDCYKAVSSARTKIESEVSEVMLCKILQKGKGRKWVLCTLIGCKAEIRNMGINPAGEIPYPKKEGYECVGFAVAMKMDEE